MAPQLSEDEIDDLLYAARTGDNDELTSLLSSLADREKVSPAEVLTSATDEGKSTCLHMATGNGHEGESMRFGCLISFLTKNRNRDRHPPPLTLCLPPGRGEAGLPGRP
jgi:hypothetical protein